MPFNHETWLETFRPMLHTTQRMDGFQHITRCLSRIETGLIVETGCVRAENDWVGAGMSTMIWDWITNETKRGIEVLSVDITPAHVDLAKKLCPNVTVALGDSIKFLTDIRSNLLKCSLLYLDSYDHNPPYAASELHAIGELAAAWEYLPSGCMIAVDDCNGDGTGKHYLIRQFFDRLKLKPELSGYIHVWRKP